MATFDSQGVDLYYEETGTGHVIIWLHEFAADYRTWEPQVRRFSRDYRCITLNARGYPPSEVPTDETDYSYDIQRDDVVRLMDALGVDRAHLVGLSMGAYTALQVAITYPDRVRSLVFSSGGSGTSQGSQESFKGQTAEAAELMLRQGMAASAAAFALGPTRIQLLNKDPRGWEEFRGYMSEHSPLGSALTLRGVQATRPPLSVFEARLRELDTPVLLTVGDEDDPVIEANLYLKRVLPRAGLWISPKTGHGMNLEEPDEYNNRIAQFLSAVERGAWDRRDQRADPSGSVFVAANSTREH